MHVLLKGLSNDVKEECRSTSTCFKDCLNVMPHNSAVYSPIWSEIFRVCSTHQCLQFTIKKEAFQDINNFHICPHIPPLKTV